MKFEIWLNGGPAPDLQALVVAGSNQLLDDWRRLDEVLPQGGSLQLVNTAPLTKVLRIAAIVDPDLSVSEKFTIPLYDEAFGAIRCSLTGYVRYLGDVTVDATASGDEIAFHVQEQFSTVPLDLHMMIFVLNHDEGGGCAKTFSSIGIYVGTDILQSNETSPGA